MHHAIAFFLLLATLDPLPSLTDLDYLPCEEIAQANLDFADKFALWCRHQASFDCCRADLFSAAQHETTRLRLPWKWLVDARCRHDSDTERRKALGKIRFAVGADNYRLGIMPPPVPVWRFARAD